MKRDDNRRRKKNGQKTDEARAKFIKFAVLYSLIALPICLAIMFWPMGDQVSGHGRAAHYLAVPLAFGSGLIFMGALFFSSNSGVDEQPNYVEMMKRQKKREAQHSKPAPNDQVEIDEPKS